MSHLWAPEIHNLNLIVPSMIKEALQYIPFYDFDEPQRECAAPDHVAEQCVTCLKKRLVGEIMQGGSTSRTHALLGYAYTLQMGGALADPDQVATGCHDAFIGSCEVNALMQLKSALDIDICSAFSRGLVAGLCFRRGDLEKAGELWYQVKCLKPKCVEVKFNLALTAAMLAEVDGEWKVASTLFDDLLKVSPDFPRARELWEMCTAKAELAKATLAKAELGKNELEEDSKKKLEEDADKKPKEKFEWPGFVWLTPAIIGAGKPKRLKLNKSLPRCLEREKRHNPDFWEELLAQESVPDQDDPEEPQNSEEQPKEAPRKPKKGKGRKK